MSRRTTRTLVLAGVLACSLGTVWLFGRQRGEEGTLGHPRPTSAPSVPVVQPRPDELARGELGGHVRGPASVPIAGATVCAWPQSSALSTEERRDPPCTRTGRDGAYLLAVLPVLHRIVAVADGFQPAQVPAAVLFGPGQRHTVDIVLEPGGASLRGTVRDVNGGAVPGALVRAQATRAFLTADNPYPWTIAQADDLGSFTLAVLPGPLLVAADAEGYAETEMEAVAPGQTVELLLVPEAVLQGRVVNAAGKGVAGIRVSGNVPDDTPSKEAWSDADGRFRIPKLTPGRYRPVARGDQIYGEARVSLRLGAGETSPPIEIVVHPAHLAEGRVLVGDALETCPRGQVAIKGAADRSWRGEDVGPDGRVRLGGLLPGRYQVYVACEGFVASNPYPALELAGDRRGLEWRVQRGRAIHGRVVDDKGAPVADTAVTADPRAEDPRAPLASGFSRTARDGSFTVTGLRPGAYRVRAIPTELPEPAVVPEVTLPEDRDLKGLQIVVAQGATIEGRVIEEGGQPKAGVEVAAAPADPQGVAWSTVSLSRDDGTFRIPGLRPGKYRVTADPLGSSLEGRGKTSTTGADVARPSVEIEARAGEVAHARLVLERHDATLRGVVRDAKGVPVGDAFVALARESESAEAAPGGVLQRTRWEWRQKPVLTDPQGHFVAAQLAPGRYTVRAYRKGGGEAIAEHVQTGSSVDLTIEEGGKITGRVIAPDGRPPARFQVRVQVPATGFRREEAFYATAGEILLEDLPAGELELTAQAPEGTSRQSVRLGPGERISGLVLALRPDASVSGRAIALEDGRPVPGMVVTITAWGEGIVVGPDSFGESVTDAAGRFETKRAPVGPAMINLLPWRNPDFDAAFVPVCLESGDVSLRDIVLVRRRRAKEEAPGDLGFTVQQVADDGCAGGRPLTVAIVRPGGPAQKAGLRVGDVITAIDGHDVTGARTYLYRALASVREGTKIELRLARGARLTIAAGPPRA